MVATGRQARSAKNRLSRSRCVVPVSIASLQLPSGCPANAKDIDELVHGESALQQLCALKAIGEFCFQRVCVLHVTHALLATFLFYIRSWWSVQVLLFSSPLVCFAVASLGIVKGKDKTNPDTPGLVDLVKGLLDILPAQGSKALHDEIKVMLKVSPD